MEYYGKEKNYYHGMWIGFLIMILFPATMFGAFFLIFNAIDKYSVNQAIYMSFGFAGLVGFVFAIICIFAGFLRDLLSALFNRIRDTIEYFGFFSKDGIKFYFREFIIGGGPILWTFFILMFAYLGVSIYGFISFFIDYGIIK